MGKPHAMRVVPDEVSDQVGRVRDALEQLESYYNDIDASIRELCTTSWVSAGSEVLLRQIEGESRSAKTHLTAFRQFYTESLSWVTPLYGVLEASISDAVKDLVNGS